MSESDVIIDEAVEEGRLVTLAEVRNMLQKAQDEREELMYEQKIALEHARRFARLDPETAQKVVDGVLAALPGIEPKYAVRVADLLPQHHDDVSAIFQKSRHELADGDMDKILEIVDAHYVA